MNFVCFLLLNAILLLRPRITEHLVLLDIACVLAFIGLWIEKGMGLIVPGFVPSTLHELVEYLPNRTEWMISAGIWAFGLMIYTLALKIALPIFTGEFTLEKSTPVPNAVPRNDT